MDSGRVRDVIVILSGKDLIIDTKAVRRYLITTLSEGPVANSYTSRILDGDKKTIVTKTVREDIGA